MTNSFYITINNVQGLKELLDAFKEPLFPHLATFVLKTGTVYEKCPDYDLDGDLINFLPRDERHELKVHWDAIQFMIIYPKPQRS